MTEDRRNPFEGVTDYFSELVRMRSLGVHGQATGEHGSEAERTHASAWVPTTDILAVGDDLVIRLELAGVEPEHVDLALRQGALVVSGTRPGPGAEPSQFYVRERFHGEFRRVFSLPDAVTAEQVTAVFEDGVLEVTVRDGATAQPGTRIALADRSRSATSHPVTSRP